MAQKLQPVVKVKTVNILLATYFSIVIAMIGFSGFFIYSHFNAAAETLSEKAKVNPEKKDTSKEEIKAEATLKALN